MKDAIVDTPAISIIDDDESIRVAAGRFALAERLDLLLLVDLLGRERSTRRSRSLMRPGCNECHGGTGWTRL